MSETLDFSTGPYNPAQQALLLETTDAAIRSGLAARYLRKLREMGAVAAANAEVPLAVKMTGVEGDESIDRVFLVKVNLATGETIPDSAIQIGSTEASASTGPVQEGFTAEDLAWACERWGLQIDANILDL